MDTHFAIPQATRSWSPSYKNLPRWVVKDEYHLKFWRFQCRNSSPITVVKSWKSIRNSFVVEKAYMFLLRDILIQGASSQVLDRLLRDGSNYIRRRLCTCFTLETVYKNLSKLTPTARPSPSTVDAVDVCHETFTTLRACAGAVGRGFYLR